MFNKERRIKKVFAVTTKLIENSHLDEQEKRNLKGLLFNIQHRVEVAG